MKLQPSKSARRSKTVQSSSLAKWLGVIVAVCTGIGGLSIFGQNPIAVLIPDDVIAEKIQAFILIVPVILGPVIAVLSNKAIEGRFEAVQPLHRDGEDPDSVSPVFQAEGAEEQLLFQRIADAARGGGSLIDAMKTVVNDNVSGAQSPEVVNKIEDLP